MALYSFDTLQNEAKRYVAVGLVCFACGYLTRCHGEHKERQHTLRTPRAVDNQMPVSIAPYEPADKKLHQYDGKRRYP